ncbi:MAG: hypothetical protein ABFS23_04185 [Pseudomonadota bacterium]
MKSPLAMLTVLVLLVAAFVGYQMYTVAKLEIDQSRVAAQKGKGLALEPLTELEPPESVSVQDFIDRPLFWKSRRPVEIAAEDKPVASSDAPPLRVTGIVRNGDQWLVLATREDKQLTLKQGDEVDGWLVSEVTADAVSLESGERAARFELFDTVRAPAGVAIAADGKGRKRARKDKDDRKRNAPKAARSAPREIPRSRARPEKADGAARERQGPQDRMSQLGLRLLDRRQ